mmetsp:Transcript_5422/g.11390  ORF Transcript_5422/g.11390 Transcript_5422/m.11390 type:complete len:87 (-) Transcript_5422:105-365(-)
MSINVIAVLKATGGVKNQQALRLESRAKQENYLSCVYVAEFLSMMIWECLVTLMLKKLGFRERNLTKKTVLEKIDWMFSSGSKQKI